STTSPPSPPAPSSGNSRSGKRCRCASPAELVQHAIGGDREPHAGFPEAPERVGSHPPHGKTVACGIVMENPLGSRGAEPGPHRHSFAVEAGDNVKPASWLMHMRQSIRRDRDFA